ncbi:hypothetical protein LWI29_004779 [Acer saccharum]|uniref:C-JID domain-containing protein n=1 Tax=Acer saccharum TaxID=4024 RepID=A0AA39W050_ACESA|nr:hypothetical protein LWI29_004779 [Acer saccharum]
MRLRGAVARRDGLVDFDLDLGFDRRRFGFRLGLVVDFKSNPDPGSGKPSNQFSIYLPGNEILEWFSYQSLESLINIQVLGNDLVNRKFMGFVICAVLGCNEYKSRVEHHTLGVRCEFETYYDQIKICEGIRYYITHYRPDRPTVFVDSDHMLLGYCSFYSSFQNPKNKLPAGDSDYVDISIRFTSKDHRNQLKRCAVHPIYAEPIGIIGATIQDIGKQVKGEVTRIMMRKWNHIPREFAPKHSRPLDLFH